MLDHFCTSHHFSPGSEISVALHCRYLSRKINTSGSSNSIVLPDEKKERQSQSDIQRVPFSSLFTYSLVEVSLGLLWYLRHGPLTFRSMQTRVALMESLLRRGRSAPHPRGSGCWCGNWRAGAETRRRRGRLRRGGGDLRAGLAKGFAGITSISQSIFRVSRKYCAFVK